MFCGRRYSGHVICFGGRCYSGHVMVEIVEPKVSCNLEVDDHGLDPTFLYYRPEGTRFHSSVGSKQVRSICFDGRHYSGHVTCFGRRRYSGHVTCLGGGRYSGHVTCFGRRHYSGKNHICKKSPDVVVCVFWRKSSRLVVLNLTCFSVLVACFVLSA